MVSSWGWQHGLGMVYFWCLLSPISQIVASCDIHRAGFDLTSITKDVLVIGSWTWQAEWYIKYPLFATITNLALVHNAMSRLIWKTIDDTDKEFSMASVWDTIRPKGTVIDWHDIVWDHVKIYDSLPIVADSLDSIVTYLIPIYRKRSARSVITKLVFVASCYFTWQKRNCKLFKNKKRSQDHIIDVIKSNVRLKLLTCKFKRTNNVKALLHLWKLPDSLI
ncbi:hypothetical protein Tco_1114928 [Tanacetum coccineum]